MTGGLLDGKVVLVSGVGPGLGRSCAAAALAAGAAVVAGDLDAARLAAITSELDPSGDRVVARRLDITDGEQIAALVGTVQDRWGRLDGVVHVAAFDTPVGGLLDGNLDDWDRAARVNVRGTLELTKAAVPLMGRGGSIVIIGSIGAVRPRAAALRMSYGASKGALVTAARYLATELGALGIRVNTVAPGWKWGPVLARYVDHLVTETGRTAADVLEQFRSDTVLHDLADDDDVADSVLFFLSDLSRKVTGQVLHVDGGGYIP